MTVTREPDPPPAASASGGSASVRVTGEATRVVLEGSGGQRLSPGSVPAGSYTLKAVFADGEEVKAGQLVLESGDSVTLKCIGAFRQCRKI